MIYGPPRAWDPPGLGPPPPRAWDPPGLGTPPGLGPSWAWAPGLGTPGLETPRLGTLVLGPPCLGSLVLEPPGFETPRAWDPSGLGPPAGPLSTSALNHQTTDPWAWPAEGTLTGVNASLCSKHQGFCTTTQQTNSIIT